MISLSYEVALFGSELEHRAEYERANIPGIVMRCIQEVDARGICLCYCSSTLLITNTLF